MAALKLHRLAPGSYRSADGRVEIRAWERPEADGYGPAGERMWYFLIDGQGGDDLFYTKAEAVEGAKHQLREMARADRIDPNECIDNGIEYDDLGRPYWMAA
jgi:hypothetical protein